MIWKSMIWTRWFENRWKGGFSVENGWNLFSNFFNMQNHPELSQEWMTLKQVSWNGWIHPSIDDNQHLNSESQENDNFVR
jgi:hypothetical protein